MDWHQSNLILSAGMPRSGSTWLYNVARLLIEQAQVPQFSCGWIDDWRYVPHNRNMLLKIHNFDVELATRARIVLYSYRDLRDALASAQRKFGTVPSIENARTYIRQDELWKDCADVVLRCEDLEVNAGQIVKSICAALDVDESLVAAVVRELESLDEPNASADIVYDPQTLVHKGHKTQGGHGTWHGAIEAKLLEQIETEFGGWFSKNHYSR